MCMCMYRSNNGRYAATGGTTGVIRLWDLQSYSMISECIGHSNSINSLKFTPDDKQIISGGDDGSIFIWCIFEDDDK